PRVKYWIKPNIENRIREGSIKAYFNSSGSAIEETRVVLNTPDGPITIPNDFVLAMTGYDPDLKFLAKNGVQKDSDDNLKPRLNTNTLERNEESLYMSGVSVRSARS